MSTLEDLNAGPGGLAGIVGALSRRFRPVSRRNVLVGATVAAAALATKPKEYALRPVSAYATICGPGNLASSGWTVFCCTINNGRQRLPAGQLRRRLVEGRGLVLVRRRLPLHRGLQRVLLQVHDGVRHLEPVQLGLLELLVRLGVDGDLRPATGVLQRVPLRPVQHPGEVQRRRPVPGRELRRRRTSGPTARPRAWSTTAPASTARRACPRWGPIEQRYMGMGDQASFLRASTGPVHQVGDAAGGVFVPYQHGDIYWTRATGAQPVGTVAMQAWSASGGMRGPLGYPINASGAGHPGRAAGSSCSRAALWPARQPTVARARLRAVLDRVEGERPRGRTPGLPDRVAGQANPDRRGWHQQFQGGFITASTPTTHAVAVYAPIVDGLGPERPRGGPARLSHGRPVLDRNRHVDPEVRARRHRRYDQHTDRVRGGRHVHRVVERTAGRRAS